MPASIPEVSTTLLDAIEIMKAVEDSESSNIKRANALIPKFSGITDAVTLLDTLRSQPETKKGPALVNWVDLAYKTKVQRIQDLKDKAKELKKEAAKLSITDERSKARLTSPVASPRKKGVVCTTRVQLLSEFNGAASNKQVFIEKLQSNLNAGIFSEKERANAEAVAKLMNDAAQRNAGSAVSKEAWTTCVVGILTAFATLKTKSRTNDLWTAVDKAIKEKITLCVKPASQSLTQFANTTLNALMLGMWAAGKVYPSADPVVVRRLYQDDLVERLRNGANQIESTVLMTVHMDPEETYLERCVQAISYAAGKAPPGQNPILKDKKARTATFDINLARGDSDSEGDAEVAMPAMTKPRKGAGALSKAIKPVHESHSKKVTEKLVSTFEGKSLKGKRARESDDEVSTGSESEEEKASRKAEEKAAKAKKAAAAKKKAKESQSPIELGQEAHIARLLAAPIERLTEALLAHKALPAGPHTPRTNHGVCFNDPGCTKPICNWEHPLRDAARQAGQPASAQAPRPPRGDPAVAARLKKFSSMRACRNFHDFGHCKLGAVCKLTHAKFATHGAKCDAHANKEGICERSLSAVGCPFKHVF